MIKNQMYLNNNMHDILNRNRHVFYSISWDLVIWNRKMLDSRHCLIHHEILFWTTHKFWGWTKEIDILHLWNNRNENSSIFSLCFYISCFSYPHSLSFSLQCGLPYPVSWGDLYQANEGDKHAIFMDTFHFVDLLSARKQCFVYTLWAVKKYPQAFLSYFCQEIYRGPE